VYDLPTESEVEALIAEAYAEAAAMQGGSGYAEASVIADLLAVFLRAWDASLRPVLADLATLTLDGDGDGVVTPAEAARLSDAAAVVVATISGGFVARALPGFLRYAVLAYTAAGTEVQREVAAAGARVGVQLGAGRPSGPVALGGPDRRTAAWIARHNTYWVTRYGERIVDPRIAGIVGREAMDRGVLFAGGTREQARRLRDALGAEYDRGVNYWRLVATAAANRSGSLGRVAALEAAGLGGKIDATRDARTTKVCTYLDGKKITLEDLRAWRDAVLAAPTAEAVIEADRWWADDQVPVIRNLLSTNGGTIPPVVGPPGYHARCRSILVADLS